MAEQKANETKVEVAKADKTVVKAKETKAKETKAKVEEPKVEVKKFSKKQFVTSHKFAKRKDILNALLEEDKEYSIKEVEDIINDFLYGKK